MVEPVSISIRISIWSTSGLPIYKLTKGIEFLMLIGIIFEGEEKMLVIRGKVALKRGRLSIFVLLGKMSIDVDAA